MADRVREIVATHIRDFKDRGALCEHTVDDPAHLVITFAKSNPDLLHVDKISYSCPTCGRTHHRMAAQVGSARARMMSRMGGEKPPIPDSRRGEDPDTVLGEREGPLGGSR